MANKPLHSTGNKPIHSTGNKPVYGDFVQWSKLYVKLSFLTDDEWVLPCDACYSTADVGGVIFGAGDARHSGPTFDRYSSIVPWVDYFLVTPISPAPATGFDGAQNGVMDLDWVDADYHGGWAWDGTTWTALVYAWRYGYEQTGGGFVYHNGTSIKVDAAVMNAAMSVTLTSGSLSTTCATLLAYKDGIGGWSNPSPFAPSPVATISWNPTTQTLTVT